jgi:hypothetical protein
MELKKAIIETFRFTDSFDLLRVQIPQIPFDKIKADILSMSNKYRILRIQTRTPCSENAHYMFRSIRQNELLNRDALTGVTAMFRQPT